MAYILFLTFVFLCVPFWAACSGLFWGWVIACILIYAMERWGGC